MPSPSVLQIPANDPLTLLAPANNAITSAVVALYQWDRFITVSIAANICALLWLAWLTFRRPLPTATAPAA